MRVEMRTNIGGYRNGEPWPAVGGIIDVPDHEAADLISQGYAKEANETATSGPDAQAAADSDEQPVADADEAPTADSEPVTRKRVRASK